MKELSKKENAACYIGVAAMIIGLLVAPLLVDSGSVKFYSEGVYGIASCLLGFISALAISLIAGRQIFTGKLIAFNNLEPGEYALTGQSFYQNSDKPCILEVYRKENILVQKIFKGKKKKKYIGELPDSLPTMAINQVFQVEAVPQKIVPAHKIIKVGKK